MNKKETSITIRTNEELKKAFRIACIASDVKQSDVIEQAMKEFINKINGGNN